MYLRTLLISLLMLGAASAEAASPTAVVVLKGTNLPWRDARRIIEEHGGRVRVVVSPDVLVGEIPEGVDALLHASAQSVPGIANAPALGLRIIRRRDDAEALLGAPNIAQAPGAASGLTAEERAALLLLAPRPTRIDEDPRFRVQPGGIVEVRPITDWEDPPLAPPRMSIAEDHMALGIGLNFDNTSGFLAGDIGVGIIRPESTGSASGDGINSEIWTNAEVTNTLAQAVAAFDKLSVDSPQGKVTFVFRTETSGGGVAGTVACDYEAILYSPNFDTNVVLNVLGKLGYTQADKVMRMREWANDIRSDLGTDWAFGIFIVDNSTDTTRGRASAYLNGPTEWLFQHNTAAVFHHEAGHTWGAEDEYASANIPPTKLMGYTQVPNANSAHNDGKGFFSGAGEGLSALQLNNIDYVSPWGRGAWGIWDLDGDGINDTQDTFPGVVLNSPTGTSTITMTGTASATPLKRETGTYLSADASINKIVAVEWRLNGGPWQNATASDGSFNSSSEGFTFTTPLLRNGPYVVEARARDNFGNATTNYPRSSVTATGSAATNNVPLPALAVTPTLGSTATSFQFSAVGSRDAEDGTNLQYRWDFEDDGIFDTTFSSSATSFRNYGSAGTKTARVEVRDQSGATRTRAISFTVSASNVPPTAQFIVDKGSLFAVSPAVFNFDASSVGDGEDATANLQVRWDFEDDGVWDTAYSTTKVLNHDYAQTLPIIASSEVQGTYLYSGNNVVGLAQSFVAGSDSIGKAEMILKHYSDLTPGGTCTVGIRSLVTGAFLTSTVINQSALKQDEWNTFDFPNISVTNGGTYFLVVVCSDGDVMWLASGSAPYSGGQHYYSLNGSSWNTNAIYDHVFRVYGGSTTTVPLTKSTAWRVRMEVKDANGQVSQAVRDIWTNAYDTPPTVSLNSSQLTGTTSTTFNLSATGSDANSGTTWDGLLNYRWDVDGDGNFETEFAATSTRSASFAKAGTYQATVEVRDRYYATARASVTLTVAPASGATQMSIFAGNNQSASTGVAVPIAPAVLVRNASSNPVSGVVVVFSVLSGDGTITNATQTTNASGIATLGSWTLGSVAGPNSLGATMPHYPQPSPLTFNATAVAPPTVKRRGQLISD